MKKVITLKKTSNTKVLEMLSDYGKRYYLEALLLYSKDTSKDITLIRENMMKRGKNSIKQ